MVSVKSTALGCGNQLLKLLELRALEFKGIKLLIFPARVVREHDLGGDGHGVLAEDLGQFFVFAGRQGFF